MAYAAADWSGFAATVATAAATLTGLLFIAVSINLQRILEFPNLPNRAAVTLVMFTFPLIFSLLVIVPGQGGTTLGAELAATGAVVGALAAYLDRRAGRSQYESVASWLAVRIGPRWASCGLVIAAGASLAAGGGGGLYWLVPATLLAIFTGLFNTWVLLVEILR